MASTTPSFAGSPPRARAGDDVTVDADMLPPGDAPGAGAGVGLVGAGSQQLDTWYQQDDRSKPSGFVRSGVNAVPMRPLALSSHDGCTAAYSMDMDDSSIAGSASTRIETRDPPSGGVTGRDYGPSRSRSTSGIRAHAPHRRGSRPGSDPSNRSRSVSAFSGAERSRSRSDHSDTELGTPREPMPPGSSTSDGCASAIIASLQRSEASALSDLRKMMNESIQQDAKLEHVRSELQHSQANTVSLHGEFQTYVANATQNEYGLSRRVDELTRSRDTLEAQTAHFVQLGSTEVARCQHRVSETQAESEAQQHFLFRTVRERLIEASNNASRQTRDRLSFIEQTAQTWQEVANRRNSELSSELARSYASASETAASLASAEDRVRSTQIMATSQIDSLTSRLRAAEAAQAKSSSELEAVLNEERASAVRQAQDSQYLRASLKCEEDALQAERAARWNMVTVSGSDKVGQLGPSGPLAAPSFDNTFRPGSSAPSGASAAAASRPISFGPIEVSAPFRASPSDQNDPTEKLLKLMMELRKDVEDLKAGPSPPRKTDAPTFEPQANRLYADSSQKIGSLRDGQEFPPVMSYPPINPMAARSSIGHPPGLTAEHSSAGPATTVLRSGVIIRPKVSTEGRDETPVTSNGRHQHPQVETFHTHGWEASLRGSNPGNGVFSPNPGGEPPNFGTGVPHALNTVFSVSGGSGGGGPPDAGGPGMPGMYVDGTRADGALFWAARKEAEKVSVPPWPDMLRVSQWRTGLVQRLVAAAGHPDERRVIEWVEQCWKSGISFDSLIPLDDEFRTLDAKLASAMWSMLQATNIPGAKDLARTAAIRANEAVQNRFTLRGRQLVWMMSCYFQTNGGKDMTWTIEALIKVPRARTLAELDAIYHQWNEILSECLDADTFAHETMRVTWRARIEDVPDLKYHLSVYDMMPDDHKDKSYAYLMHIVETVLSQSKDKQHRVARERELEKAIRSNGNFPLSSLPATGFEQESNGSPKGKKKNNKKEKRDNDPPSAAPGPSGPAGSGSGKKPCEFFHFSRCKYSDRCKFSHDPISDEQKRALKKIYDARTPPATPRADAPTDGNRGRPRDQSPKPNRQNTSRTPSSRSSASKGSNRSNGSSPSFTYCHAFAKDGQCTRNPCRYKHLTQEQVDAKKKELKIKS